MQKIKSLHFKCFLLLNITGHLIINAQTSFQDFGTNAVTYSSGSSGTTAYIPNPSGSGTTWARGSNGQGGSIAMSTASNPLGTSGAYIKVSAATGASAVKVCPIVNYTSATEVFYSKFKMLLGDASGGTSATSGEFYIITGSGSTFSDGNTFSGSQTFTGLRLTYGSGGTVTANYRNGGSWSTANFTTSVDQGVYLGVEIVGNNQTSGTINYTYNGVSQSVAAGKQDIYINGVIIGDNLNPGAFTSGADINSIMFYGISSTSSVAYMFLDDVTMSPSIPSSLGGPTDPSPFSLSSGNYSFSNWPSSSTIGTYPANMIFHYADVNITDPSLAEVNATQDYLWGYNYTKSTRINGQGTNGFSFVNTNPGQVSATSGNLGEAVLAINTTCRQNVQVSWKAGTITTNTRVYKLRAQYRIGNTGSFTDLPNTSVTQIEYTSPNTATNYGPITLPSSCDNVSLVQIRWVYYWSSGTSSSRHEINLTNISVTSSSYPSQFSVTGGGSYCSGATSPTVGLANSQSGVNYQLYNGASTVGSPVSGTGVALNFGNQSTAGTYTVKATSAVNSCTANMSGSAVISVNPLPTVTAVSSQTVCGGKVVTVPNFTSSPSGATFFWNNTNTNIGLGSSGIGNVGTFTSSIVSSGQTGNISVTANLSGCFGPQLSFNIQVNGAQPSTVWTGAVSSDWNNSDNWTNCVCGSSTNATIAAVSSPSFNPVITTTAAVNDITLDASSSLSVSGTQALDVYGNWTNNGTFTTQTAEVNFTGTSSQNISGLAATTFYNVTLNNSNGLTLSSATNVRGTLQLNSGVFDTSNLLTLSAGSSSSGRIGPINSSADIINQVNVEQYAQPGYTGWALMGSPIVSSLTMADWNDNFPITCLSCPNGYNNFTSIYSYNEAAVGTYSDAAKYVGINAINDPIVPGTGYWVYLGTAYPMTSAIVFDTKGTVAKSTCISCSQQVELPLSYTNQGSISDDGWNLISNPLPSPISWTALRNNDPNVDDAIYAYNADKNNGAGGFVSYVNGVASTTVGGISDTIPMCQGVYIHATGNSTLVASESIKVNANPSYLKQTSSVVVKPILRLKLNQGATKKDESVFYFENGATIAFDKKYDSYRFVDDPSQAYMTSLAGNRELEINGLPDPLSVNLSVPLKVIVPAATSYTFSALTENFPAGVCAQLLDTYNGTITNLLTSSYICMLSDTTTQARFKVNFSTGLLNAAATIQQPSCDSVNSGKIVAAGLTGGPWNYVWKDASNTIIKTTTLSASPDSLTQLVSGTYKVWINSNGTCNNYSQQFNVNPVSIPVAQYTPNADTLFLSAGAVLSPTNQSQNAVSFSWNFGDGSFASQPNPTHTYTMAGVYQVKLVASASGPCVDSVSKQIVVFGYPLGIQSYADQSVIKLHNPDYCHYTLSFHNSVTEKVSLQVSDISGKIIVRREENNLENGAQVPLSLEAYSKGIYVLTVNSPVSGNYTFRLIRN